MPGAELPVLNAVLLFVVRPTLLVPGAVFPVFPENADVPGAEPSVLSAVADVPGATEEV